MRYAMKNTFLDEISDSMFVLLAFVSIPFVIIFGLYLMVREWLKVREEKKRIYYSKVITTEYESVSNRFGYTDQIVKTRVETIDYYIDRHNTAKRRIRVSFPVYHLEQPDLIDAEREEKLVHGEYVRI